MLASVSQRFSDIVRTMRKRQAERTQTLTHAFLKVVVILLAVSCSLLAGMMLVLYLPFLLAKGPLAISLHGVAKSLGIAAFGGGVVLTTIRDLVKSFPNFVAFYRQPSLKTLYKPVSLVFVVTVGFFLSLSIIPDSPTARKWQKHSSSTFTRLSKLETLDTLDDKLAGVAGIVSELAKVDFTELAMLHSKLATLQHQFPPMHKKLDSLLTSSVRKEPRRWVIQASGALLFPTSSQNTLGHLPDSIRRTLDDIAIELNNQPQSEVRIEGHTDRVPIHKAYRGHWPTNWELSKARAAVVARYLETKGVLPHRLTAVGYAFHRPAAINDDNDQKSAPRNRRVEIVLVPSIANNEAVASAAPLPSVVSYKPGLQSQR